MTKKKRWELIDEAKLAMASRRYCKKCEKTQNAKLFLQRGTGDELQMAKTAVQCQACLNTCTEGPVEIPHSIWALSFQEKL